MSSKKYRPESEGAVFDRRATTPPTEAELAELLAVDPLRDRIIEAQFLATTVLTDHYGQRIKIRDGEPWAADQPLQRPLAGSVPEVVVDAFEMLDLSRSVRTLERVAVDDAFAATRAAIVRNLSNCMMMLGMLVVTIRLRLEGVEAEVFARASQRQNLQPRTKKAIEELTLRAEWDRAQRIKPNGTRQAWQRTVAARLGTSERTIKRRLAEFQIV